MVAYTYITQVNMLYNEQSAIDAGIEMLDNGGKVSAFTVSPPYPDPNVMGMPMMMPVQLSTVAPSEAMTLEVRAAMVTRHNEIAAELAALGVTDTPPAI